MKRIGLTGNIGTGKSTVAGIFEILKVPVYYADKQARAFLNSDKVKTQITAFWGNHLIDSQNLVDRKKLASIVFNDKSKLEILNNIIHPLVEEDFSKWCSKQSMNEYIIHEAAILFESGFNRLFDANILVTAPEELCISRVMKRDSLSEEVVRERLRNQWTQQKKQEMADYVISNDEKSFLIPQVLAIHRKILHFE